MDKKQNAEMTNEKDLSLLVLNSLMVGWELVELLDKIKDTTAYRYGLKQKVNSLLPELEKFVDQLGVCFEVDKGELPELLKGKKELMEKLSVIRPQDKQGLSFLLDDFFKHPELTLMRSGIRFKEDEINKTPRIVSETY